MLDDKDLQTQAFVFSCLFQSKVRSFGYVAISFFQ